MSNFGEHRAEGKVLGISKLSHLFTYPMKPIFPMGSVSYPDTFHLGFYYG